MDVVERPPGRVLAVDYGDARVGLAITDELRLTVRPLETLKNRGRKHLCGLLAERAKADELVLVVVGDPVNADDSVGPRARTTRAFAGELADTLAGFWAREGRGAEAPPVVLWDEGGSTQRALDLIHRRGSSTRRERRRGGLDQIAAAVILQDWLDLGAPEEPAIEPSRNPEREKHREGGRDS